MGSDETEYHASRIQKSLIHFSPSLVGMRSFLSCVMRGAEFLSRENYSRVS